MTDRAALEARVAWRCCDAKHGTGTFDSYHGSDRNYWLDVARAAIAEVEAAGMLAQQHHEVVPGGPPCPTCGFRIRHGTRVPFVLEDDDAPQESDTGQPPSQQAARQKSATAEAPIPAPPAREE